MTISIDTTHPKPVPAGFSGFNMNLFDNGTSYDDPIMTRLARSVSPGWIRFPAGTADSDYDWTTGLTPESMLNEWRGDHAYALMARDAPLIAGKKDDHGLLGLQIADHTSFVKRLSEGLDYPVQTIGVINTFTDTPASAASLVQWAVEHKLSVPVWELGNEPNFAPLFYSNSTDFLNKAKPYADAIKHAVPGAQVAVYTYFLSGPGKWNPGVASYSEPYWDSLYYHSYFCGGLKTADSTIACLNWYLLDKTSALMEGSGYFAQTFGSKNPNFKVEVSEYDVDYQTPVSGGIYNGIFDAEYAVRMSTSPHVTHVGIHRLVCRQGSITNCIIASTNDHAQDCINASTSGTAINTSHLDFGYFLTAAGVAMKVVNPAINRSSAFWDTTVTGAPTISYQDYTGAVGTMAAIYAQAYQGGRVREGARDGDAHVHSEDRSVATSEVKTPGDGDGHRDRIRYLVITNKSAIATTATIVLDGMVLDKPVKVYSVSSSDPRTANTIANPTALQVQESTSEGQVSIPAYSVTRVEF